jgi:hypothetical protein
MRGRGEALPKKPQLKKTAMTKQTAKKTTTTKQTRKTRAKVAVPEIKLAAPEAVIRHQLIGICDIVLVDPEEQLPENARKALFDEVEEKGVVCVIQCAGYVFNLAGRMWITFVDKEGNRTGASYDPQPQNKQQPATR